MTFGKDRRSDEEQVSSYEDAPSFYADKEAAEGANDVTNVDKPINDNTEDDGLIV